jgi:hypothetical protein
MGDLRPVAAVVRRNAERYLKALDRCPFGKDDLREFCAFTALALSRAFRRAGYFARPVFGFMNARPGAKTTAYSHCWVEVITATVGGPRLMVWDVSATQFGAEFPPVHCVAGSGDIYEVEYELPDDTGAEYWKHWTYYQRPTEDVLAVLLEGVDDVLREAVGV